MGIINLAIQIKPQYLSTVVFNFKGYIYIINGMRPYIRTFLVCISFFGQSLLQTGMLICPASKVNKLKQN